MTKLYEDGNIMIATTNKGLKVETNDRICYIYETKDFNAETDFTAMWNDGETYLSAFWHHLRGDGLNIYRKINK